MKGKTLLRLSLFLNLLGVVLAFLLIRQLGGWNFFRYRLAHRGVSVEFEHRKSLYEQMAADTATIVFFGNSLTAQCDWAELLGRAQIRNRGIPGDRVSGLIDRLDNIVGLQPKQIFLMIGINDLLYSEPAKVLSRYRELVQLIRQQLPDCHLYLQSVLPVNNSVRNTYIRNEDVEVLNEGIRQLASELHLPFIDLRPVMSDERGRLKETFTLDGVHLTGAAYREWGELIAPYLD